MVQRKLGRGLDFLISGATAAPTIEAVDLPLDEIRANPYQPRHEFVDQELAELARSIEQHGVIQPVVVRAREGGGYDLIAGERRYRASQKLGRPTIPAIVRAASDDDMLELALIENLQRSDLNAIETAKAYCVLIERLGISQEDAAHRVGKSRPAVANAIRLLDLPGDIQEKVAHGELSAGHGRALLSVDDVKEQRRLAQRVIEGGLSVRATEAAARRSSSPQAVTVVAATPEPATELDTHLRDLEDQLRGALGTKVAIQPRGERGKIVIEYFSHEELDALLDKLLRPAAL